MQRFETLGYSKLESLMLYDMLCAITQASQWKWLAAYQPPENKGFLFSDAPELKEIDKHIEYKGHSGATYTWCMRIMQVIAQTGFRGLAKLRGVNVDWETFLKEVESIPAFQEQAAALRKFEKGELTYAQMRELCG
jgi:hypothetical protein